MIFSFIIEKEYRFFKWINYFFAVPTVYSLAGIISIKSLNSRLTIPFMFIGVVIPILLSRADESAVTYKLISALLGTIFIFIVSLLMNKQSTTKSRKNTNNKH
jgi:hypothetical protein